MNKLVILVILVLIGLLVHYPSLQMSIYGDEWIDVYHFNNPIPSEAQISPLPGPLKYFTPYGFGIFLIGSLYQIFGTHYQWYFIISLIFKIFSAFCIYLICLKVPLLINDHKTKQHLSLLTAILLLVGFTGLENTDWSHYMHIYLAAGLFLLTLFFQLDFLQAPTNKNRNLTLLFAGLALIIGTVRIFPLVFILPLFDSYLFLIHKDTSFRKKVILKCLLFILTIGLFWAGGLFGYFFKIYSYGEWSLSKFMVVIITTPIESLKALLYWIGSVAFPDYLLSDINLILVLGFLILVLIIKSLSNVFNLKNISTQWRFLSSFLFLFFILVNWYYLPKSLIGSAHRYLFLIFVSFCLWLYIYLTHLLSQRAYLKNLIYFVLITIIVIHAGAVINKYNYWLSIGRDSQYIQKVDTQLKQDFPKPLTQKTMIYLMTNDESIKQSTIFGMSVKVAVFSKTWSDNLIPESIDDKNVLINKINDRINKGEEKIQIIANIYGYQVTPDKNFISITDSLRTELLVDRLLTSLP